MAGFLTGVVLLYTPIKRLGAIADLFPAGGQLARNGC